MSENRTDSEQRIMSLQEAETLLHEVRSGAEVVPITQEYLAQILASTVHWAATASVLEEAVNVTQSANGRSLEDCFGAGTPGPDLGSFGDPLGGAQPARLEAMVGQPILESGNNGVSTADRNKRERSHNGRHFCP